MAGHSKWANIKHKKGKADAARGKVFSKIAKEIMVAASHGGGNPDDNIQLRTLIQKAKSVSMPKDNIERSIKKGTGELEGGRLEEGSYEGYAAGGVAIVVKVLTDNKNRSASEVRHAFNKAGANLAEQGSVSRMFHRMGQIFVDKSIIDEEVLMEYLLETDVDDFKLLDSQYEILCDAAHFDKVSDLLTSYNIEIASSGIVMIPDIVIEVVDLEQANALLKFIDALEDLDDVQDVYANFDISNEVACILENE